MSAADLVARALKYHQAGNLRQAELLYRQALEADPRNADAYHLLGAIACQTSQYPQAVVLFRQALALNPAAAAYHSNLGMAYVALGQLKEAEASYQQALRLSPQDAEIHYKFAVALHGQDKLDQAIVHYQQAIGFRPMSAEVHNNLGSALASQRELDEAIFHFQEALRFKPDYAQAHCNLGNALVQQGKRDQAVAHFEWTLQLNPNDAAAHNGLGVALADQGNLPEAVAHYRQALHLMPDHADAHNNLGSVLGRLQRFDEAGEEYQQALRLNPHFAEAHNNLGSLLVDQGRLDEAVACFQRATQLKRDYADAHNNLGLTLAKQGKYDQAATQYQRGLQIQPHHADAHNNLGVALAELGRLDDAMASCRRALKYDPNLAGAHANLGTFLAEQGMAAEAERHFREAMRLGATKRTRILLATLLPPIYQSTRDLLDWRQRLTDSVRRLHEEQFTFDMTKDTVVPLFLLAYQGFNDRELQCDAARLYVAPENMASHASLNISSPPAKIRVGFISKRFKTHTIGELMGGLIAHLSREIFSVTVFSVGDHDDAIGHYIRQHADTFVPLPAFLPVARQKIAEQNLDVLIYTDIGMDAFTYSLAFSRLAPIQCVTWGHPETTGIPTLDYYLSSDLFETKEADQHYTEALVRLKAVPFYFHRPTLPAVPKKRGAFGLPEERTLYACPQSAFKFHPDFDNLMAEVLRNDPRGMLVLNRSLEGNRHWDELLMARFRTSMTDVVDRVLMIPRVRFEDYLAFNAVVDVLLDPIPFNGGNTTLKSLALGVPVVTWPTGLLRGRLTLALYKQMNVLDCIAGSAEEYVNLAVKLGTDADYRAVIRIKILAAKDALIENKAGILALEEFLQHAVLHARAGAPPARWPLIGAE